MRRPGAWLIVAGKTRQRNGLHFPAVTRGDGNEQLSRRTPQASDARAYTLAGVHAPSQYGCSSDSRSRAISDAADGQRRATMLGAAAGAKAHLDRQDFIAPSRVAPRSTALYCSSLYLRMYLITDTVVPPARPVCT